MPTTTPVPTTEPFDPSRRYVLATEWSVATETCASLFDGAKLRLHRYLDEPNEWGGHGAIEYHEFHGTVFPTSDDARAFAFAHGFLVEWTPARRDAALASVWALIDDRPQVIGSPELSRETA